jgi:hypothetical protein
VILACFERDKAWDDICVKALEDSVRRWVVAFVREAIKDDWKEARAPNYWLWEEEHKESIVSPLCGFARFPGNLFGRAGYWRSAEFLRAKNEEHQTLPFRKPPPPPPDSPGGCGGPSSWSVCA